MADLNRIGDRGGNITFSKAGLRQAQITGHYNEFQIQNNVFFTIDGVFGASTAVDNANQYFLGANYNSVITGCNMAIFAIWINNTNVLAVTRGPLVDPAKLGGTGGSQALAAAMPDVMANNSLVGLIKVKVGTAVTFTPGTTNFNATNITTTFYDCSVMPSAPFLS